MWHLDFVSLDERRRHSSPGPWSHSEGRWEAGRAGAWGHWHPPLRELYLLGCLSQKGAIVLVEPRGHVCGYKAVVVMIDRIPSF